MADSQLTDPLGRTITLHDRTWHGHILKGHPEVEPYRDLVEQAVRDPYEIRQSRSDENCRLYFGRGPRETVRIMVVADVVEAVVKTAHLCRRVTGGEREWRE